MDSEEEEYHALLAELFPSKYIKQRVKDISKNNNEKKRDQASKPQKSQKLTQSKKHISQAKKILKDKFIILYDNKRRKNRDNNYDSGDDDDDDDDDDHDDDDDMSDDSDESDYEEEYEDESEESEDEEYEDEDDDNYPVMEKEEMDKTFTLLSSQLNTLSEKYPDNTIYKSCLEDLEWRENKEKNRLKNKQKREINERTTKFRKIMKNFSNEKNEFDFFKNELGDEEQTHTLTKLNEITNHIDLKKPYILTITESDIPLNLKSIVIKKIVSMYSMMSGQGESTKIKYWIDNFMQIPFGKYKNLSITYNDGIDKCHEFMTNAKNTLDEATYGMNDAKMQIMQFVGQWITNPEAIGSAIAIKGPMGTGKTTLVKEGISKVLGREFEFIALGGATDSSFLEGHSYTYEGSTWGKIVEILIKSKSMNPVIYFDELDKISDSPKGEEITGILTHLTDTSQNTKFHDKYFSEIDFDLSKCLFIFSYNDETRVNPILLDRMYKIQTKGYEKKEKLVIANKYLLPSILKQVGFATDDITFPDETITYILENYTNDEAGVRNLKRCLEIICTKLNMYRLLKPGSKLFDDEETLDVSFPYSVKTDVIRKLIKKSDDIRSEIMKSMYV